MQLVFKPAETSADDRETMQPLIQIIDDDQVLSEAISETLGSLGYRVMCSENSEEGINLARKNRPNLILCDVVLPDAAGFDTVAALRSHPATSRVPVVLMTGFPYVSKYEGEGKCLLLLKPFSLEMLVDVVKGTIGAQHDIAAVA